MRSFILILVFFVLLVIPILAEIPKGNPSDKNPHMPPSIASIYLNPDSYVGQTITMKGIVSASFPNEHRFILSDSMGCVSCQAVRKESKPLSVIFSGVIPDKRDIVLVSGNLTRVDGNTFSINATSVKK